MGHPRSGIFRVLKANKYGNSYGIRKCETCIILGILVISIGISPTPAVKAAALADTYPIAEWGTGEAASISYSADGL